MLVLAACLVLPIAIYLWIRLFEWVLEPTPRQEQEGEE